MGDNVLTQPPKEVTMKSVFTWGPVFAAGLLSSFQAIAQQPPMQVPMVPQAIETHMQQKRTLEQREAIEAKKSQSAASAKPAAPVAALAPAPTAPDCEAKAVSKSGKPLHGAIKASFIKKCESDAKGRK